MCQIFCCSIIQGVSFNYHQRNVRSRVSVSNFNQFCNFDDMIHNRTDLCRWSEKAQHLNKHNEQSQWIWDTLVNAVTCSPKTESEVAKTFKRKSSIPIQIWLIIIIIMIFYCGLMVHITDTRAQKVVSYATAHITETVFTHDQHWEEQSSLSSPQLYRPSQKHRKWITIH